MTQLIKAQKGELTPEMILVAESEGLEPESLRELIAQGKVVLPKNRIRKYDPIGIGQGLRTKVNANIGTSPRHLDLEEELEKLRVAIKAGADAIMDLSTGGDLDSIRRRIIEVCPVCVGTVPIYQVASEISLEKMDADSLFQVIEKHAASGVDFITVHCGITQELLPDIISSNRLMGVVSRGGSMLVAWMKNLGKENPLFEHYDRLLDIALEYDVTLSLGDGLRPGSVCDATDDLQIEELRTLGRLAKRAFHRGVQCMIEGPGHVPLNQIAFNIELQKKLCNGAPFYVLGPITTDIAPGFDHITAAIGGSIAAAAGADFLCYVTPAEHLRLPTIDDVRQGVVATRIAAHSGDIVKGVPGALETDKAMSEARKKLDWEKMYSLAIDPEWARKVRRESESYDENVCSMCGQFCSINMDNAFRNIKTQNNQADS
ncbi:MAG: phosphomethylpyrimidine synthase ThiC [Planctomycetota bacterium]